MVSFLGSSKINLPMVCDVPVVPSTSLRTLILDDLESTLRTCTFSSPIERISLSLTLEKERSPVTPKNVTRPVTPTVPIATPVVPVPAIESLLVEMPAL